MKQYLNEEFLSKYANTSPWKNPMGQFVYLRTYSRWQDQLKCRESWADTHKRVTNYSVELYSGPKEDLTAEAEEMFDDNFNIRWLPAGRTMWVGGTDIVKEISEANFNCSFTTVESISDFKEIFFLLMVGTGVGFSVEDKYICKLPKFNKNIKVTIKDYEYVGKESVIEETYSEWELNNGYCKEVLIIGDSREAWSNGLEKFLDIMTYDESLDEIVIVLDYIRPAGSKLKRFGGTASGPEPYANMLRKIKEIIDSTDDGTLKSLDVLDICNIIAENVVAGGVRRSAQLALADVGDDDTIFAKINYWDKGKMHRAMSNNSVAFWQKPNKDYLFSLIESIRESYEPGFINMEAAARRRPWFAGLNPCVTSDTWIMTEFGPRQVKELIGIQHGTYVNGELFSTTAKGFWKTGTKKVYKIKTKEGYSIRLTDNHKIKKIIAQTQKKQYLDWVETKDLKLGDKIKLHNHREILPWNGSGTFEDGWIIGELIGDGTFNGGTAFLDFWGESKTKMAENAVNCANYKTNVYSVSLRDKIRVNSKKINELAKEYGIIPVEKAVTPIIEKASYDFYRGFLRGFFDADGTVLVNKEKGSSVRLCQANLERLEAVQRMLARLGIVSTIYKNRNPEGYRELPDGHGGKKEYFCKTVHELCISNDNIGVYEKLIGFSEPKKLEKLKEIMDGYVRTPNRERFSAEIESIEEDGFEDVYDCTVPGPNEFDANGIEAHNCCEILLPKKGFCNLTTIFLKRFIKNGCIDYKELARCIRAATRHCMRITNCTVSMSNWDVNQKRDRLLGVNVTGCEDVFEILNFNNNDRSELFKFMNKTANDEAIRYAGEMRIPAPLLVCTVQPGGTLSQLDADGPCSPGFHKSFGPLIKRTVRISSHSALAKVVLKQGYKVYPDPLCGISSTEFDAMSKVNQKKCLKSVTTWVVVFGFNSGAKTKASDESAISQLERYKIYLRDYADHNVSATIQVGDDEWDNVMNWIYDNWDDYIGVSFQNKSNDKYDLPPYEVVNDEQYQEIIKNCPDIDINLLNKIENGIFTEDDDLGSDCTGGACPIR